MVYRYICLWVGILLCFSPVRANDDNSPISFIKTEISKIYLPIFIRPMVTPLIDCPFDVIVIKKQVHNQPYSAIIRETYGQFGIKGFYQGLWPKFCGAIGKNLYTWPALTYGPEFFHRVCPNVLEKIWGGNQFVSSVTFASIDSFFITPIERIRILQITQPQKFKLSQLKLSMIPEMFRGTTLMFQQGFVNCFAFLFLEKIFRTKAKEINNMQELSWFHYASIGTTISLIQTTLTHPLTTLRVKIQAEDLVPVNQQKREFGHLFWQTFKNTSIRNLQAGWVFRFARMAVTASMDSYFLNHIDQNMSKTANKKA